MQTPPSVDPRWAWQRYQPSEREPWNLKKVGHLFRRAAFGASLAEMEAAVREGPDRTIDGLLQNRADANGDEVWNILARGIGQANNGQQLPALWLYRMLYSPNPLREKMTLFWHNHFATSNLKVRNAKYMLGQYDLMRQHALGSFRTLLLEMSHDPAMMVWLDTTQSRRGQPNENYARELMELFSLGINHPRRPDQRNYTEQDIREAARAFTGWTLENDRAVFKPDQHDDTEKNVLGQRGRWQSRDIVRICLEQEAAPYFIVAKLYRWLVSETVPATPDLLEPLARSFRDSDYNFGALVEQVLRSNLFFAPLVYRTKVKAPIDFVLEIVRGLEGHREEGSGRRLGTTELANAMEGLGQRLFHPPSVAGWEGGRAWLNGQTFLLRQNLALALTSTVDDRFGRRLDPAALARRQSCRTNEQTVDLFVRIFLEGEVPAETRNRLLQYLQTTKGQPVPVFWTGEDATDHRVRSLCHLVLGLPEFQLG
jgi:uncharacterized protein (DUF1800 family)